ncbi:MAG: hypothetical protein JWN48_6091, partial [Myxococcaceae bacterium]|nr:hypothetical protein [Myxococcaceae bacterium]
RVQVVEQSESDFRAAQATELFTQLR